MSKINTYLNTASTYRKHSAEELLISDFLKFEIRILTSFGKRSSFGIVLFNGAKVLKPT
tara:strand:- start:118 stop:294 length:177 start_codon:yes stop_codon:yes gene_type:complete